MKKITLKNKIEESFKDVIFSALRGYSNKLRNRILWFTSEYIIEEFESMKIYIKDNPHLRPEDKAELNAYLTMKIKLLKG